MKQMYTFFETDALLQLSNTKNVGKKENCNEQK